jgi:hypothetical protein
MPLALRSAGSARIATAIASITWAFRRRLVAAKGVVGRAVLHHDLAPEQVERVLQGLSTASAHGIANMYSR